MIGLFIVAGFFATQAAARILAHDAPETDQAVVGMVMFVVWFIGTMVTRPYKEVSK